MSSLNCPKCNGILRPLVYKAIEIDRCQQCAGMWFDSQEAETLKKIKGSDIVDLDRPEISNNIELGEEEIYCPRCQEQMIRILDIDKYNLWYEKCLKCNGVWLDAGEFKQYRQNFRSKNFFKTVKRKFQH